MGLESSQWEHVTNDRVLTYFQPQWATSEVRDTVIHCYVGVMGKDKCAVNQEREVATDPRGRDDIKGNRRWSSPCRTIAIIDKLRCEVLCECLATLTIAE